jgi:hypothetical protein
LGQPFWSKPLTDADWAKERGQIPMIGAAAHTLSVVTNSFTSPLVITTAITVVAALLALTLRAGPAARLPAGAAATTD